MAKIGYTGTTYTGVVGPEGEIGLCRDSIDKIARRPGDALIHYARATKGYEARQQHINNWLQNTTHDFILLLDQDMVFEPDTLERLRRHELAFVSGYYLRRQYAPMLPTWFKPFRGSWPMEPWTDDPERGRLHKIGASGWGVMLMHRQVLLDTRKVLKGEADIIEDDMDVWPYDLGRVLGALAGLKELVHDKPGMRTLRPALEAHTTALLDELKPLRMVKTVVGSDIRYPFYAKAAGHQLWGDPDVRPAHMLNYPLSPDDYSNAGAESIAENGALIRKHTSQERRAIRKAQQEMIA